MATTEKAQRKDDDESGGGGRMLTVLLVAAAGIAVLYLAFGRGTTDQHDAMTWDGAVATPEAMKCIDERCAPRPERLNCLRRDGSPATCVEWQIVWKDRCQCVERAAPRDAGAP